MLPFDDNIACLAGFEELPFHIPNPKSYKKIGKRKVDDHSVI